MGKTVYVIIGCDTDPDRKSVIADLDDDAPGWLGLKQGIPRAKERAEKIQDADGNPPVFSWCLRVDDQIRHFYGDYAWVLKEHKILLQQLADSGDELSWHPHFWRLRERSRTWYQEIDDHDWQVEMLGRSFAAYAEVFPDAPRSARMGWNYHNSRTMATLSDLGIRVEFSAVPGLRLDRSVSRKDNIYDWYRTPGKPYHPLRNDYQVPGLAENALPIAEIPNLVSRSFWWGIVAGLVLAKKMKDIRPIFRAVYRPRYVINMTAAGKYYAPIIRQFQIDLKHIDSQIFFFNGYFHADEMAKNKTDIYSAENFVNNVRLINKIAAEAGARAKFIKACQAVDLLSRQDAQG